MPVLSPPPSIIGASTVLLLDPPEGSVLSAWSDGNGSRYLSWNRGSNASGSTVSSNGSTKSSRSPSPKYHMI